MKFFKCFPRWLPLLFILIMLIADAQTATEGVHDGIEICIRSVIPALYPFLIFVPLICQEFAGKPLRFMKSIAQLCKLPAGSESVMLFGMLGGYPTGAALIAEAYHRKQLNKADARRMMGFCSNAGPAFIFGILAPLFEHPAIPWLLWFIHITSAVAVGYLSRQNPGSVCNFIASQKVSIVKQIEKSTKTMAIICAWIVVFRLAAAYMTKWIIGDLSADLQIVLIGIMELSNGCIMLRFCSSEWLKFIICSGLLSFGGLCVALQTRSVCNSFGIGNYFPGKLLQATISILLSLLFVPMFTKIKISDYLHWIEIFLIVMCMCIILIKKEKNYGKKQLFDV